MLVLATLEMDLRRETTHLRLQCVQVEAGGDKNTWMILDKVAQHVFYIRLALIKLENCALLVNHGVELRVLILPVISSPLAVVSLGEQGIRFIEARGGGEESNRI